MYNSTKSVRSCIPNSEFRSLNNEQADEVFFFFFFFIVGLQSGLDK